MHGTVMRHGTDYHNGRSNRMGVTKTGFAVKGQRGTKNYQEYPQKNNFTMK